MKKNVVKKTTNKTKKKEDVATDKIYSGAVAAGRAFETYEKNYKGKPKKYKKLRSKDDVVRDAKRKSSTKPSSKEKRSNRTDVAVKIGNKTYWI